jgi:hypothetical protein
MITGVHTIIYTANPESDRLFFRDMLELSCVDAGGGWLIFAMPPAESAFHPGSNNKHELYLMCDDVNAEINRMVTWGIDCSPVSDEGWGLLTRITLPGGGQIGMYQPKHRTATKEEQSEPDSLA